MYYMITCPHCEYSGGEETFEISHADEAFCPACGGEFTVSFDDIDEDEES